MAAAAALLLAWAAPGEAAPQTRKPAKQSLPAFTVLGVHPGAAAQPTATGRIIQDLEVFGDEVFAGYGDYGANTGPIDIAGFDPSTRAFRSLGVADTEAAYTLREIGGTLYVPSTDPRASADFTRAVPWAEASPVRASHAYDMATLTGSDLWLVGSQGDDAVAWRSLDGGSTWAEALRVAPRAAGDPARFYFAAALGGRLYVQAADYNGGPHPASLMFDGAGWQEAPHMLPDRHGLGWHPEPFGGGIVYHSYGHAAGGGVIYFDGVSSRYVASGYDFAVRGSTLFVLGHDGIVRSSDDLATWTDLTAPATTARSVEVTTTEIIVGTTDAELLRAPLAEVSTAKKASGRGGGPRR